MELLKTSKMINYGDFNFRTMIKVLKLEEWVSEEEVKQDGKYSVEILIVSPEQAGEKLVKEARESQSFAINEGESINAWTNYLALAEYGVYACLYAEKGNNLKELMKVALKKANQISFFFGIYMDNPVNMLGATGWDAIKGEINPYCKKVG
jgi:hypothetical protein